MTNPEVIILIEPFKKMDKIVERRSGDIASCYADPSKAEKELGWKAELGIEDMMRDSYNFILKQGNK